MAFRTPRKSYGCSEARPGGRLHNPYAQVYISAFAHGWFQLQLFLHIPGNTAVGHLQQHTFCHKPDKYQYCQVCGMGHFFCAFWPAPSEPQCDKSSNIYCAGSQQKNCRIWRTFSLPEHYYGILLRIPDNTSCPACR